MVFPYLRGAAQFWRIKLRNAHLRAISDSQVAEGSVLLEQFSGYLATSRLIRHQQNGSRRLCIFRATIEDVIRDAPQLVNF